MKKHLLSFLRRTRTEIYKLRNKKILCVGCGLHIGKNCCFWAPNQIKIGNNVYIGKYVTIENDTEIGDNVLIANNVSFLGKYDHDFREIGTPIRFAPWIGGSDYNGPGKNKKIIIESDVWVGYGSILLSGIKICKGSIIAAGSIVTKDIPPYAIFAGNPAKQIGVRFNLDDSVKHEKELLKWNYTFSELGYEYWKKEPVILEKEP